jgi:hypothetical protein
MGFVPDPESTRNNFDDAPEQAPTHTMQVSPLSGVGKVSITQQKSSSPYSLGSYGHRSLHFLSTTLSRRSELLTSPKSLNAMTNFIVLACDFFI